MGLPDISPVPKKDSMGMDYIPVYEGDQDDGNTVKVSPGRLQRTGVKTELVGKLPIIADHQGTGRHRFRRDDDCPSSPCASTASSTRSCRSPAARMCKKGDPLMSVFGQELLNASVQIIVEEVTGWKGPENEEATAPPARVATRAPVSSAPVAAWRTCRSRPR